MNVSGQNSSFDEKIMNNKIDNHDSIHFSVESAKTFNEVGKRNLMRLEQQAKLFSEINDIHGDLSPAYHYWSKIFVEPYLRNLFGVEDALQFYLQCILQLLEKKDKNSKLKIVSIGSGDSQIELRICEKLHAIGYNNIDILCVDIAFGAIQRAKDEVEKYGLADNFRFMVCNIEEVLEVELFDVVIANQVLHHIVNLEILFDKIQKSIRQDGAFLSVDIIGRNGHMFWPETLIVFDKLWERLENEKKFNRFSQSLESNYLNWDHSKEGNEGVRAEDILANLNNRFVFSKFFAVGCIAPILFGRQFGPNFNPDNRHDRELIELVGRLDHDLIDIGYFKPVLMYAMMQNTHTQPNVYYRHWSPVFCCRNQKDFSMLNKPTHYEIGNRLCFGGRREENIYLHSGWSSPEINGVWSNYDHSLIVIPLTKTLCVDDISLTLEGQGHVCAEKPTQIVRVSVEGIAIGDMKFVEPRNIEIFKYNIRNMLDKKTITIRLDYSDTRSPSSITTSNDVRHIAFFLHSITMNLN